MRGGQLSEDIFEALMYFAGCSLSNFSISSVKKFMEEREVTDATLYKVLGLLGGDDPNQK
jgi:hypothetical protein